MTVSPATMWRFDAALRIRVRTNLARWPRRSHPLGGKRHAAVALTLLGDTQQYACFIITRRAAHLRRHAGQWALPGGRLEADESPAAAARRELAEEIGLTLTADHVLGLLDDYSTRSGFVITPVVLWGQSTTPLQPDPNEVAAVHCVPLSALEQPAIPRLQRIPQSDRPVLSLPLQTTLGSEIFAPTAAILYQLREVALHGRSARVEHYEQPLFAWR